MNLCFNIIQTIILNSKQKFPANDKQNSNDEAAKTSTGRKKTLPTKYHSVTQQERDDSNNNNFVLKTFSSTRYLMQSYSKANSYAGYQAKSSHRIVSSYISRTSLIISECKCVPVQYFSFQHVAQLTRIAFNVSSAVSNSVAGF